MVHYYFDFRDADKQKFQGLLSSLLFQLAGESDACHEILSLLYTAHGCGAREPSDDELIDCLEDMLEQHRQATYIIIDAIDECLNTFGLSAHRGKVLKFLERLANGRLPHLRICIASRPEVDIRDTLEPLRPLRVSLHEECGQRKEIHDYVTKVVGSISSDNQMKEEDRSFVTRILAEESDGM